MMRDDHQLAEKTVAHLLQINAIKINVRNPFTWVSGIRSPIYCDNRQILSYPDIRSAIASDLTTVVSQEFPDCDVIAGVATGAIAHGVLVADRLNKAFIYVRSSKKGHGLGNQVEGQLQPGSKVVVIEDLVSTGQSSLAAVDALRSAGADVMGMVAIFSYELPQAIQSMERSNCLLITLGNFSALLKQVANKGMFSEIEVRMLSEWRNKPDTFYHGQI